MLFLVSVVFGECCVYVVLVSVVLGGLCVLMSAMCCECNVFECMLCFDSCSVWMSVVYCQCSVLVSVVFGECCFW